MDGRRAVSVLALLLPALVLFAGCKQEAPSLVKPPFVKKTLKSEPAAAIIRTNPPALSKEQREELAFPEDVISKVEHSAGVQAEPFFTTIIVPSENLKGDKGFEKNILSGFSIRTQNADELIHSYRSGLRVRGFLIFKSHRGYGSLPDMVTVVRGNNSYDLLKIQSTEAVHYKLGTKAIIVWLKNQQKSGSFYISGAGPDWIEARFVRQPADMLAFAKKILAFAPDVRHYGPRTADKLAARMKKSNGFYLAWD